MEPDLPGLRSWKTHGHGGAALTRSAPGRGRHQLTQPATGGAAMTLVVVRRRHRCFGVEANGGLWGGTPVTADPGASAQPLLPGLSCHKKASVGSSSLKHDTNCD